MAETTTTKLPAPQPIQATPTKVELTYDIVKKYICPTATEQEIFFFIQLCKAQGLNPFLEEAYLIKYDEHEPAKTVVSKDAFMKRAVRHPQYNGFKAGIIVLDNAKQVQYREGSLLIPGEQLLGGWAIVFRKDWEHPIRAEVSLEEYMRKKKDGNPIKSWKEMPATMIRKVAIVQAHREAFPEELAKMYVPEEMPVDVTALPKYSLDVEIPQPIAPPKATEPISEPRPLKEIIQDVKNGLTPKEAITVEPQSKPKTENMPSLTEKQRELMDALLFIYDGDMEAALQRLEKETTFESKQTGKLVRGTKKIEKLKDVSCEIVLRQIQPDIDRKNNLSLPLEENKGEAYDDWPPELDG